MSSDDVNRLEPEMAAELMRTTRVLYVAAAGAAAAAECLCACYLLTYLLTYLTQPVLQGAGQTQRAK